MATAICSLVTGTPVNSDVAMTGEVTLTGQVLPIGGLKEKTLAAQRAGITTVILPSRNEADLEDVPEELRKGMTFIPADRVEQVWEAAMGLRLDARTAGLIEAGDLIEEAGELLEQARRKAGSRLGGADGGPADGKTGVRKPAGKKPAATKPGGTKPAATKPGAKTPAAKKAAVKKPPPGRRSPAAGGAKKATAARGRSGRKR